MFFSSFVSSGHSCRSSGLALSVKLRLLCLQTLREAVMVKQLEVQHATYGNNFSGEPERVSFSLESQVLLPGAVEDPKKVSLHCIQDH